MKARPAQGFAMIEVLVTILVLLIGLIGMFGLLSRSSVLQMEAYQRSQALTLLRDMEGRLRANAPLFDATFRTTHASSAGPTVFGQGSTACTGTPTGALAEACAWSNGLRGGSEREGSATGTERGAMVGARGCLLSVATPSGGANAEFFIVVVWQGLSSSGDPEAGTPAATCASGVNFGTGQRRAVVSRVLIPRLVG